MPGNLMRRSTELLRVFNIAISLLPLAYTINANLLASGDHPPDELM